MGETERRRRRLRSPSTAAPAAETPATETPATAPGSEPVNPAVDSPVASEIFETPASEVMETPASEVMETPASDTSRVEDPAGFDTSAQRPAPPGLAARPTRSPGARPTSGAGAGGDLREAERGLRGLVGSGSSQVSVGAALRARDAARPSDAQLAEADENLVIIRRNWLPREDLPRNR